MQKLYALLKVCGLLLLLTWAGSAQAQVARYFVGANLSNFNAGTAWSLTSGGAPIGGTITWAASDTAVFDANSGSRTVLINNAYSIARVRIESPSPITVTLQAQGAGRTFTWGQNTGVTNGLIVGSQCTLVVAQVNEGNAQRILTVRGTTNSTASIYGTAILDGSTLSNSQSISAAEGFGNGGTINLLGTGTYWHNCNGGNLAFFSSASVIDSTTTIRCTGMRGVVPASFNGSLTFGKFIWDCPNQTDAYTLFIGSNPTITFRDSFIVRNTAGRLLNLRSNASTGTIRISQALAIGGNANEQAMLNINTANGATTINLNGSMDVKPGGNLTALSGTHTVNFGFTGTGGTYTTTNPRFSYPVSAFTMPSISSVAYVFNSKPSSTPVTLSADIDISGTVTVNAGAILAFGTGTARTFTFRGGNLTTNGTIDLSGGSLAHKFIQVHPSPNILGTGWNFGTQGIYELGGTATQTIPTAVPYSRLRLNNPAGAFFNSGTVAVSTDLELAQGILTLPINATLEMGASATFSGTFSNSRMISAVGTVRQLISSGSGLVKLYPVGANGKYLPVNITAATITGSGNFTISARGSAHPLSYTPDRIGAYWILGNTGITLTSYTGTLQYSDPGDVEGNEANYNGTGVNVGGSWTANPAGYTLNTTTNQIVITAAATASGQYTAGATAGFVTTPPTGYKVSLSASAWGTATTWNPNGVPAPTDIVILRHAVTNNPTFTVAGLTIVTGVTFTNVAGTSATVNGPTLVESGATWTMSTNGNIALNGDAIINGTVTETTSGGTNLIVGRLTLGPGFTFSTNTNQAWELRGGIHNNSPSNPNLPGNWTLGTNAQTISGLPLSFTGTFTSNTQITNTISVGDGLQFNTTATPTIAAAGFINSAGAVLTFSAGTAFAIDPYFDFSAAGNTLRFANISNTYTIPQTTFGNIFCPNAAGIRTFSATSKVTVNGDFTLTNGTVNLPTFTDEFEITGNLQILNTGVVQAQNTGTYVGTLKVGTLDLSTNSATPLNLRRADNQIYNLTVTGSGEVIKRVIATTSALSIPMGSLSFTGASAKFFDLSGTFTLNRPNTSTNTITFSNTGGTLEPRNAGFILLFNNPGAAANVVATLSSSTPLTLPQLTLGSGTGTGQNVELVQDADVTIAYQLTFNQPNNANSRYNLNGRTLKLLGNLTRNSGRLYSLNTASRLEILGSGAFTNTIPTDDFINTQLKTVVVNRANSNGNVVFGGFLTINDSLVLIDGPNTFNGAGTIIMGENSWISRRGAALLSVAPTFGATVNLEYAGTTSMTTGLEFPATTTVLREFKVATTGGATVTVGATPATRQVNRFVTLASGSLLNLTNNLTVVDNTLLRVSGGTLSQALSISAGKYSVRYEGNNPSLATANELINTALVDSVIVQVGDGNVVNLNTARTLTGTLHIESGIFDLGTNNLTLAGTGVPASVVSPSGSRMIRTSGSGWLIRQGSAEADFLHTYPVGSGTQYGPVTFNDLGTPTVAPGSTLQIRSIAAAAPTAQAGDRINRHWRYKVSGITGYSANLSMNYADGDISGNEANYTSIYGDGFDYAAAPAGTITQASNAFGSTAAPNIAGFWTAGSTAAFSATTLYSIADADYNVSGTWSLSSGGPSCACTPTASDKVVVENHTVTLTGSNQAAATKIAATGLLEVGSTTSNTLGSLVGTGVLRFTVNSGVPTLPTSTDEADIFLSEDGGTVNYSGSESYALLPLTTYGGLSVTGSGVKTLGNNITTNQTTFISTGATLDLSASNPVIQFRGNVTVDGSFLSGSGVHVFDKAGLVVSGATAQLTFGNAVLTQSITSNTDTLAFGITPTGSGVLTLGANKYLKVPTTLPTVDISSLGNWVVFTGSGNFNVPNPGGSGYRNLRFDGTGTRTINYNLTVDSTLIIKDGTVTLDAAAVLTLTVGNLEVRPGATFNMSGVTVARTHLFNLTGHRLVNDGTVDFQNGATANQICTLIFPSAGAPLRTFIRGNGATMRFRTLNMARTDTSFRVVNEHPNTSWAQNEALDLDGGTYEQVVGTICVSPRTAATSNINAKLMIMGTTTMLNVTSGTWSQGNFNHHVHINTTGTVYWQHAVGTANPQVYLSGVGQIFRLDAGTVFVRGVFHMRAVAVGASLVINGGSLTVDYETTAGDLPGTNVFALQGSTGTKQNFVWTGGTIRIVRPNKAPTTNAPDFLIAASSLIDVQASGSAKLILGNGASTPAPAGGKQGFPVAPFTFLWVDVNGQSLQDVELNVDIANDNHYGAVLNSALGVKGTLTLTGNAASHKYLDLRGFGLTLGDSCSGGNLVVSNANIVSTSGNTISVADPSPVLPASSLVIKGAGNLTWPSVAGQPLTVTNLTLQRCDNSGQTVTFSEDLNIAATGKFTWKEGVLDMGSKTLTYGTNATLEYQSYLNAVAKTVGAEWPAGAAQRPTNVTLNFRGTGSPTLTLASPRVVAGTFTLTGGELSATGNLTYTGTTSTLFYNSPLNGYTRTTGDEWPAGSPPASVGLNLTGTGSPTITMSGNRTLTGSLGLGAGTLADNGFTVTIQQELVGTSAGIHTSTGSGKLLLNTNPSGSVIYPVTVGNLELDNPLGGRISGVGTKLTVTGTLTLTNGLLESVPGLSLEIQNPFAGGTPAQIASRIDASIALIIGGTGPKISLPPITDLLRLTTNRPNDGSGFCATLTDFISLEDYAVGPPAGYYQVVGDLENPSFILQNIVFDDFPAEALSSSLIANGATVNNVTIVYPDNANTWTVDNSFTIRGRLKITRGTVNPASTGAITYGGSAGLEYNNQDADITPTTVGWPLVNGPKSLYVTMGPSLSVNLPSNRTLTRDIFVTSGTLNVGANTLTSNGDLTVEAGGTLTGTTGKVLLNNKTITPHEIEIATTTGLQAEVEIDNATVGATFVGAATIPAAGTLRLTNGQVDLCDGCKLTYNGNTLPFTNGTFNGFVNGGNYTSSLQIGGTGNLTLPEITNGLSACTLSRAEVTLSGVAPLPCSSVVVSSGRLVGSTLITYVGTSSLRYEGGVTLTGKEFNPNSEPVSVVIDINNNSTLVVGEQGEYNFPANPVNKTFTIVGGTGRIVKLCNNGVGSTLNFQNNVETANNVGNLVIGSGSTLDVGCGTLLYNPGCNIGCVQPFVSGNGTIKTDRFSTFVMGGAGDMTWPGGGALDSIGTFIANRAQTQFTAGVINVTSTTRIFNQFTLDSGSVTGGNNIIMMDGSLLERVAGTLTGTPTSDGRYSVKYSRQVTPGVELPTAASNLLARIIVDIPGSGTIDVPYALSGTGIEVGTADVLNLSTFSHTMTGTIDVTGTLNSTGDLILDPPAPQPRLFGFGGSGTINANNVQLIGDAAASSVRVTGAVNIGASGTLTMTTGILNLQGGTLTLNGDIANSGTAVFTDSLGTGTLSLQGSGPLTGNPRFATGNMGTLVLNRDINLPLNTSVTFLGTLDLQRGTLQAGANTLGIGGTMGTGTVQTGLVTTATNALTGTVSWNRYSMRLSGAGTLFTTELQIGDLIYTAAGDLLGRVTGIASNTVVAFAQSINLPSASGVSAMKPNTTLNGAGTDFTTIPNGTALYHPTSGEFLGRKLSHASATQLTLDANARTYIVSQPYQTIGTVTLVNTSTLAVSGVGDAGRLYLTDHVGDANTVTMNRITSGNIRLVGDLSVVGNIGFSNGLISTGRNKVVMGPSAVITGEGPGAYLVGSIEMAARPVNGADESFGGIGVVVRPQGQNLGNVTVLRMSGAPRISAQLPFTGNQGISRSWRVESTAPQPFANPVLLDVEWNSDDDNAKNLSLFRLYKSEDFGDTWGHVSQAVNANARRIAVFTRAFSDWTGGDVTNPLPVTLTHFAGKLVGEAVRLDWSTITEVNNARFEVERSVDGMTYTKIGTVEGAGNSQTLRTYQHWDQDAKRQGVSKLYYRLRQVDFDGTPSYSDFIAVNLLKEGPSVRTWPNPFREVLSLEAYTPQAEEEVVLRILNLKGQEVVLKKLSLNEGYTRLDLAERLPAGVYQLQLRIGQELIQKRITKE